jgi:phosphopantetheine adenylyltransferase
MRILYLGSFDPAHMGHYNTYLNARKYFGEPVEVCICINDLKESGVFGIDERLTIAKTIFPDATVSAYAGKDSIRELILSADAFVRGFNDEADKQYAVGLSKYYGVSDLVDKVHFFKIDEEYRDMSSTNIKARLFTDPEFVKSAVGELGYKMLLDKLGNRN